jgi:hypothetical protein
VLRLGDVPQQAPQCSHGLGVPLFGIQKCACGARVRQLCGRCSETPENGFHIGLRCMLRGYGQLCRVVKCHDYVPGKMIVVEEASCAS